MRVNVVHDWIPGQGKQNISFFIVMGTLETLPDVILEKLERMTIRSHSDYAEHIHIRILSEWKFPVAVILCGSESAANFGVGAILRRMKIFENSIEMVDSGIDLQPLVPLRGVFFDGVEQSFEHWKSLLQDFALLGNNAVGIHFPESPGIQKSPHFQSQLVTFTDQLNLKKISRTALPSDCSVYGHEMEIRKLITDTDIMWISTLKDLSCSTSLEKCNPQELIVYTRQICQKVKLDSLSTELWLGTSGLGEEELDVLFQENDLGKMARAIISGPLPDCDDMIRLEMPFDMLLVVMTFLSPKSSSRFTEKEKRKNEFTILTSTKRLAKRFYETAPFSYGAIGISSLPEDELQRFVWSTLCWSPQPELGDILEQYGQWYFGAGAAPYIRRFIETLEFVEVGSEITGEIVKELNQELDDAEKRIQQKMKPLAEPRLQLFRQRVKMISGD